jgi:predicted HTH domain antitoxin
MVVKIAGLGDHYTVSRVITIEYPESLPDSLQMRPEEFEQEARLAMAVKLFERSRLSSGQAASLVGMTRRQFLGELHRFGVSAIQVDVNELEEDVKNASHARNQHQSGD